MVEGDKVDRNYHFLVKNLICIKCNLEFTWVCKFSLSQYRTHSISGLVSNLVGWNALKMTGSLVLLKFGMNNLEVFSPCLWVYRGLYYASR